MWVIFERIAVLQSRTQKPLGDSRLYFAAGYRETPPMRRSDCKLSLFKSLRVLESGHQGSQDKKKLRVGVLFGGRSGEHEVSLASAASVIRGLDPDKYEAVPIGITKDGHWLVGEGAVKMLPEVLKGGRRVMLTADPTEAALVPLDRGAGAQRFDVIFPVMHGTFGEDGTIQGMLELADIPFVGAGVLGSAIGMDKDVSKRLCEGAGIPVVPWVTVFRWRWEKEPAAVQAEIEAKFEYPVFVKPATLGSSVGMTKVHNAEELAPALKVACE